MLALSSTTFLAEANKKDVFVCIFYNESVDSIQEIVLRVFRNNHQTVWATIGYLDVKKSPDIPQMFGISEEEPAVLIMRNQVVLFSQSLSSLDKYDIPSLMDQAKKLDMKEIKNEIQTEKESTAHLFGRRVCPTVRRTRKK